MEHRGAVRVTGYMLIAVVALAVLEFGAFVAVRFVLYPRLPSFFYEVPAVDRTEFDHYMRSRDPVLGWPSPNESLVDEVEPRPSPTFPGAGDECVSLYGDSYTFADEVSDAQAWGNVLAERLGCKVSNFGVGGYGTDQAYLRFRKNERDASKVTILGIFPYNVLRNINQYRYFITAGETLSLKPRFVIRDKSLSLVPLPGFSYEEFLEALRKPATAFKHETFLPDSEYGPRAASFPYSVLLFRLLTSERITNWIRGKPSWISFLEKGHPSEALSTSLAIIRQFADLARARGKRIVVLVFPTASSFSRHLETGEVATESLTDQLRELGLDVLDLHTVLPAHLETRSYCEILTDPSACRGHYNAAGNELVADVMNEFLRTSGSF